MAVFPIVSLQGWVQTPTGSLVVQDVCSEM